MAWVCGELGLADYMYHAIFKLSDWQRLDTMQIYALCSVNKVYNRLTVK